MLDSVDMFSFADVLRRLLHGTAFPNRKQRAVAVRLLDFRHQMNQQKRENPGNGQVIDPAVADTSRSDGTAQAER